MIKLAMSIFTTLMIGSAYAQLVQVIEHEKVCGTKKVLEKVCPAGYNFDTKNCILSNKKYPVKPTNFIHNRTFYYKPQSGSNPCKGGDGWFDGKNCSVAAAPAGHKPFIHGGRFYVEPRLVEKVVNKTMKVACPKQDFRFDSQNCFFTKKYPVRSSNFIYNKEFYYTAISGSKPCSGGAGWFDGKNCSLGGKVNGFEPFIHQNKFYVKSKVTSSCQ